MPVRKPGLSRWEKEKYQDYLKKLRAEGHDLEIPEEWSVNTDALAIEVGQPWENEVLDLGIMGAVGYYAVRLRMISRRAGVTLLDHEFTTDWDDQIELFDVELRDHRRILRSFGPEQKEVLNSRFEAPLRFHNRGQIIEGWLVAAGSRPIPQQYREGATVRCNLTFWDQFGHKIGAHADLSVHRPRQKEAPSRPTTGLDEAEHQDIRPVSVGQGSPLWVPTLNFSGRG